MIDLERLAVQMGFETEEVAMLLEMFLESTQSNLQALHEAIASEDYEAICNHAHSIKGSAANLTLESIYLKAKSIEEAARKEESIDYDAAYEALHEMIASIQIAEAM